MSTITSKDGTEIYHKEWGEGPIVTFSHGWPLTAKCCSSRRTDIESSRMTRRGHGRSSQASSGNDMNGYSDDLATIIEALDLQNATLIGHSTGGGEVTRYISVVMDRSVSPKWFLSLQCRRSC